MNHLELTATAAALADLSIDILCYAAIAAGVSTLVGLTVLASRLSFWLD